MKKIKKNSIILFLVTFLILFLILKKNFKKILSLLFKINILWLIISIIAMVLYWIFRTLSMYLIIKKYSNKIKFFELFNQTLITQFFNGITPFSTGGQPMEIYMLNKSGLTVPIATNVILQNFIVYQISLVLYGIFSIIINYKFNIFSNISLMKKFVILGFLINSLVCAGLFIISFSKKISLYILKIITKVGYKIKVIRNKKEFINKNQNKIDEFHKSARLFIDNKGLFIKEIILNIIALTIFYSIPIFLIISLFNFSTISLATVIVASSFVLLIGSFVPIPGGTGGIEFGFLKFFGVFFMEPSLSALLLIWRFITYYLGIIIGGIAFNFYKGVKK